MEATRPSGLVPSKPINLGDANFQQHKYAYYAWLRENAPVAAGKITVLNVHLYSRYDDCMEMLKDPRFKRNRSNATGKGGRFPFPLPKSIAMVVQSMIQEDDPNHRRLRTLVQKAFSPKSLASMEKRIHTICDERLDAAEGKASIDLLSEYAKPIPVTVIGEMVGVTEQELPKLAGSIDVLSEGFSGWRMLRTVAVGLPRGVKFMREIIARKRANPGDDILSELIHAEEDGDRLTDDELVAMLFLLIIAGHETTLHLITNGTLALLQHPDQLALLRSNPDLISSAVEEMLRYCGPVHGTKMNYASEDLEIHGVRIRKGDAVMPLLGSANRDPRVFNNPDTFDIRRTPNKHLAFSQGMHFCLGAFLARLETRIAINKLLERAPDLRLAVPESELELQRVPAWHRYVSLPVALK